MLYPTSPWKYALGMIDVGFWSQPVTGGSSVSKTVSDASVSPRASATASRTTSWPELPSPAEASSSSSPDEKDTGISVAVGSSEVLVLARDEASPSARSPAARVTPRVSRAPTRNARRVRVAVARKAGGRVWGARPAGPEGAQAENNDRSANLLAVALERGGARRTRARSALTADMVDARLARSTESWSRPSLGHARLGVAPRSRSRGRQRYRTRPRLS